MHAPLIAQCAHKIGALVLPFEGDEPFEQCISAVCEANLMEQRLGNGRHFGILLHHGGQLFVVTNEHKFGQMAQQSHELRF